MGCIIGKPKKLNKIDVDKTHETVDIDYNNNLMNEYKFKNHKLDIYDFEYKGNDKLL